MWLEKFVSKEFILAILVPILGSIAFFNGQIDQNVWLLLLGFSQGTYTVARTVQKIKNGK